MASYNKVILMGNLTRDPELRVTQQGTSICKFTVAVSRQIKYPDGTSRDEATFVDVDAFGKQGDLIAKYLVKGRPILVEGRLRMDQWETQTGEKRSKLGVVLENFQFVGSRQDDDTTGFSIQDAAVTQSDTMRPETPELVEDLSRGQISKNKKKPVEFQSNEDVPF